MENYSDIETIDYLIGRYLSGGCSASESEQLITWINTSDENRRYFTQYKFIWLKSGVENVKFSGNKWERLLIRIEQNENKSSQRDKDKIRRIFRLSGYAALILLLLGMVSLYFYFSKSQNTGKQLTENVINVPYGSKLLLTLPDNSKVWINSGSRLVYDNKFGIDNRNIRILGEAYFDVAKNPDLPFVVHAGEIDIRALGTAFNVKAYPEDHKVEATLVHGSIEVKKQGERKQILLKPREKVTIINSELKQFSIEDEKLEPLKKIETKGVKETVKKLKEEVTIDKKINIEKETAWKDGKLIFESEPLESLSKAIMRKYDVTIEFSNIKLKNYKFSGTFRDMPLEQLLDAMKFSAPIDYEIKEKRILIMDKLK